MCTRVYTHTHTDDCARTHTHTDPYSSLLSIRIIVPSRLHITNYKIHRRTCRGKMFSYIFLPDLSFLFCFVFNFGSTSGPSTNTLSLSIGLIIVFCLVFFSFIVLCLPSRKYSILKLDNGWRIRKDKQHQELASLK